MKIKIVNNSIVDKFGEKVILKGVSIPDPYRIVKEDKDDIKKILEDIQGFGSNVIRVPIKPSLWQGIPNFLEKYIDIIVEKCEELGLYCILDWHAIGNPIKNETRMKDLFYIDTKGIKYYDYESNLNILKKAWKEISLRYGKKNNILFELFNEPAPEEKDIPKMGLSALYWKDWKKELLSLIKIIRKNSKNIIIASPIEWAYNLSKVVEDPLKEENIIYSVHPYPIKKNWKENFDVAVNKIPLIVTEWGFKEDTSSPLLKATKKSYGYPIINYMKFNNISWVAWCYDFIWGPRMLEKKSLGNEKKLTEWGKFVLNNLKI